MAQGSSWPFKLSLARAVNKRMLCNLKAGHQVQWVLEPTKFISQVVWDVCWQMTEPPQSHPFNSAPTG